MTSAYLDICSKVLSRMQAQDFKSYDLCDVKALKPSIWMYDKFRKGPLGNFLIRPQELLINRFPQEVRKLVGVRTQPYAQAQSLVARASWRLEPLDPARFVSGLADEAIDWTIKQRSPGFRYPCFGQPYDWYSGRIIPANTPRTTVTSQVGQALLDGFAHTGKPALLEDAKGIGLFFAEEMRRSVDEADAVCFAYTAIDDMKVHNPNMMAAGFLCRLGSATEDAVFTDLGLRAATFSMRAQNADGSWFYQLLPENKPSKIDNYHTGYVLEGLIHMKRAVTQEFPFQHELTAGAEFFRRELFRDGYIPKMTPTRAYPIDIQCCAQAIITFCALAEEEDQNLALAKQVIDYTLANFYDVDGYFYYRRYGSGRLDKTPYIRWGDAWMLYALAEYSSITKQKTK